MIYQIEGKGKRKKGGKIEMGNGNEDEEIEKTVREFREGERGKKEGKDRREKK